MDNQRPKVGVGVILVKDGKVLLGKRKGSHGPHTWSFPGGHLEFGESIEDCGRRELMEETGLSVGVLYKGPYTNDYFVSEEKHYVTVYVIGAYSGGEPIVCEPEKCDTWEWFAWDELPTPLFLPVSNLFNSNFDPIQSLTESS